MGPALLSMGWPQTTSRLPVPSDDRATAMWGKRWGKQILPLAPPHADLAGELVLKAQHPWKGGRPGEQDCVVRQGPLVCPLPQEHWG